MYAVFVLYLAIFLCVLSWIVLILHMESDDEDNKPAIDLGFM